MIQHEASNGFVPITAREVYRVNRIRLAQTFHIDPRIIDTWPPDIYYDALEVTSADNELNKIK